MFYNYQAYSSVSYYYFPGKKDDRKADWFAGILSRSECETAMKDAKEGQFLVREKADEVRTFSVIYPLHVVINITLNTGCIRWVLWFILTSRIVSMFAMQHREIFYVNALSEKLQELASPNWQICRVSPLGDKFLWE